MTVDEAQIKALYQRHAVQDVSVDDVMAVLSQSGGWGEADDTALDRVAASATASAVTQIMLNLEKDIAEFEQERTQAKVSRPVRHHQWLRRSLAMAAGVAAVAFMFALLPKPGSLPAPTPMAVPGEDVILSLSFEGTEQGQVALETQEKSETIFRGNFDS